MRKNANIIAVEEGGAMEGQWGEIGIVVEGSGAREERGKMMRFLIKNNDKSFGGWRGS